MAAWGGRKTKPAAAGGAPAGHEVPGGAEDLGASDMELGATPSNGAAPQQAEVYEAPPPPGADLRQVRDSSSVALVYLLLFGIIAIIVVNRLGVSFVCSPLWCKCSADTGTALTYLPPCPEPLPCFYYGNIRLTNDRVVRSRVCRHSSPRPATPRTPLPDQDPRRSRRASRRSLRPPRRTCSGSALRDSCCSLLKLLVGGMILQMNSYLFKICLRCTAALHCLQGNKDVYGPNVLG